VEFVNYCLLNSITTVSFLSIDIVFVLKSTVKLTSSYSNKICLIIFLNLFSFDKLILMLSYSTVEAALCDH